MACAWKQFETLNRSGWQHFACLVCFGGDRSIDTRPINCNFRINELTKNSSLWKGTFMADGETKQKSMTIIVTKGTLDWAYPPFILATTAAAMGVNTTMFFTFYGLGLLMKKLDLKVSPLGNPAMKMPMMGMHMAMPNMIGMLPGITGMASGMMKNMIKKKGVASIPELREMAQEADVNMIACQMTLDLFELNKDDMIDGVQLGGAATWMENALKSDINLYI
jgi:peroxiredoxin family protein